MRFAQWMMGVAIVGVAGAGAFWYIDPGEASRLRRENEMLLRQQHELQRTIERLIAEDRIAEVRVVEQTLAGQVVDGEPAATDVTTIEFVELDRDQNPLPAKRFKLCGSEIHFDALVVKFEHELVKAGDPQRGKSLALFRRIYCENQMPSNAFWVDPAGDVPNVYRVNPTPSAFEKRLWKGFWEYATRPELAEEDGVRSAAGMEVYQRMRKGQVWRLTLEHSGGLSLTLRQPAVEGENAGVGGQAVAGQG